MSTSCISKLKKEMISNEDKASNSNSAEIYKLKVEIYKSKVSYFVFRCSSYLLTCLKIGSDPLGQYYKIYNMKTETLTLTCPKEVYHKDLEDTIAAIKEVVGSAKKSIVLNLYLNSKEPAIGLRTKINSLYPTSGIWTPKNERKTTENSNLVFIKCGNKLVKVDLKTILFAHTDSKNYCSIITSDGKKLSVRYSIQKLTKRLNASVFVQTHRSYIINWEKINSFHESNQTIEIEGHHIPIGRTFKDNVYKKLLII